MKPTLTFTTFLLLGATVPCVAQPAHCPARSDDGVPFRVQVEIDDLLVLARYPDRKRALADDLATELRQLVLRKAPWLRVAEAETVLQIAIIGSGTTVGPSSVELSLGTATLSDGEPILSAADRSLHPNDEPHIRRKLMSALRTRLGSDEFYEPAYGYVSLAREFYVDTVAKPGEPERVVSVAVPISFCRAELNEKTRLEVRYRAPELGESACVVEINKLGDPVIEGTAGSFPSQLLESVEADPPTTGTARRRRFVTSSLANTTARVFLKEFEKGRFQQQSTIAQSADSLERSPPPPDTK